MSDDVASVAEKLGELTPGEFDRVMAALVLGHPRAALDILNLYAAKRRLMPQGGGAPKPE